MATTANERQVGGNHYGRGKGEPQHWDMVWQFKLDYFQAQVTRYLFRWRKKGGLEDLLKARHYLDKYIELAEAEHAATAAEGSAAGKGYVDQEGRGFGVAGRSLDPFTAFVEGKILD